VSPIIFQTTLHAANLGENTNSVVGNAGLLVFPAANENKSRFDEATATSLN